MEITNRGDKFVYDVDLVEVIEKLELEISNLNPLPIASISQKEYLTRLKFGADYFRNNNGFENNPYVIVVPEHPGFGHWFSLFLSMSDWAEVILILDYHYNQSKGRKSKERILLYKFWLAVESSWLYPKKEHNTQSVNINDLLSIGGANIYKDLV